MLPLLVAYLTAAPESDRSDEVEVPPIAAADADGVKADPNDVFFLFFCYDFDVLELKN